MSNSIKSCGVVATHSVRAGAKLGADAAAEVREGLGENPVTAVLAPAAGLVAWGASTVLLAPLAIWGAAGDAFLGECSNGETGVNMVWPQDVEQSAGEILGVKEKKRHW